MTAPHLRPATQADHERLRELTLESKAHWGYDLERVRSWAATLDFAREIWVAEMGGEIVAWAALRPADDGVCELDDLWVEPAAIRSGIGTRLFRHAADQARAAGACALRWEAEPNAVGFYERMGAETVGTTTSEWGRTLPVMQVEL
jgi:N-acetylglutamate synthase-like GNAT family acetyltransferase